MIYGRADATLNIGGVRIGTAEIYRQVEPIEAISDCLAVADTRRDDEAMVLLVVLNSGFVLDDALATTIRATLKANASPRHVPRHIVAVPALPSTRSGKKVELAVARLLNGQSADNTEALSDAAVLDMMEDRLSAAGLIHRCA